MDIEEAIDKCAVKLEEYKSKVNRCAENLLSYQKQIEKLTTTMSNELKRLKANIVGKHKPQIVYIERDRTTKTENYRKQHKFRYRTIDSFGVETLFATKRELMDSLDITEYELGKHFKGEHTVLDELQIIVEKI